MFWPVFCDVFPRFLRRFPRCFQPLPDLSTGHPWACGKPVDCSRMFPQAKAQQSRRVTIVIHRPLASYARLLSEDVVRALLSYVLAL